MNVERLSIFNARTDRSNPRLGARLENNTDIPFEAGPVTFFQETRYAGEAVLDYLPRGEKTLISYGVDNEIQISSKSQTQPENTVRLTVSKGVAVLFMESVLTTTYEIRNKGMDRKTLIVEHPRLNNRTLKGIDAFETTESFHRFRVALNAGQQTTLSVPEVVARQTSISLTTLARPQLTLFAGKETPQAVREKLGQIVDTQEQIATMRSQVQSTQSTVDTLFRDQERLRENLKALRDGNEDQQLRTRYLDQLRRQEDQIDASRARIDSINKEIAAAQSKLNDLISNLTFGN
jgi:gas vesicle protein